MTRHRHVTLALGLALMLPANVAIGQTSVGAPVARAEDCPGDRSPILILGTYHMANPGLDADNVEADDVFSERRQREIGELVSSLGRFQPTKVMLEAPRSSDVQQQRYSEYLQDRYELSRNEIDQIGFRLARASGLTTVSSIDYPMWMSGQRSDELDLTRRPPRDTAAPAREPSEADLRLRRSTVSEYLRYLNDEQNWRADHLGYMRMLEPNVPNVAIYARVDQLTNWYARNFRMWSNIIGATERPKDRVLILVGAGHIAIMRQLALDTQGYCLVEPAGYL